jgi:hypothetical protein
VNVEIDKFLSARMLWRMVMAASYLAKQL